MSKLIAIETSVNQGGGKPISLQKFVSINNIFISVDGSTLLPHSASPCLGVHPGGTVTASAMVTTISSIKLNLHMDMDTCGCGHMRIDCGQSFVTTA
tara:strand:+ start:421 stop:711 length:291 start_codon:yes stop_codon:yes gene_type:complete